MLRSPRVFCTHSWPYVTHVTPFRPTNEETNEWTKSTSQRINDEHDLSRPVSVRTAAERCFKLETITVCQDCGRCSPGPLLHSVQSRGKRGWIIECTAAATVIGPCFNSVRGVRVCYGYVGNPYWEGKVLFISLDRPYGVPIFAIYFRILVKENTIGGYSRYRRIILIRYYFIFSSFKMKSVITAVSITFTASKIYQ